MNLHFIDSTLREGLQSPGGAIFPDEASKLAYIETMSGLETVDRFELYMPGPHLDGQTWQRITSDYRDKTQIYVGSAHTFNIGEREELLGAAWPMLSTTLIAKDETSLARLPEISELTHGSPLRVGLECAGELDPARALELIHALGQIAGVAVINVNDSNARMNVGWIDGLAAEMAGQNVSELPKLGFHLHNGEVEALVKAKRLIKDLGELGLSDVELDVTAFGLGDRRGVLAMAEAMRLLPEVDDELINGYRAVADRLVLRPNIDALSAQDNATSHYDERGKLRPEYLHV